MGQEIEISAGTAITPADMIGQAITSGAGVEVMAQLLTLQKEWNAMEARKAFDNAMAGLRENMPTVSKSQKVDFTTAKGRTNYRYEDLSAVTEALSPVMAGLGLSFRWRTDSANNGVSVTCIISHREGHSEETSLTCGFDNTGNKNAIQALGSAVTYLQRYTLKAAVGIAASQDDDGQGAASSTKKAPSPKQSKANSRDDFEAAIEATRASVNETELQVIWKSKEVQSLPEDWKQDVSDEINTRLAEIKEANAAKPIPPTTTASESLDSQFPGDLPASTQEAADNLRAG